MPEIVIANPDDKKRIKALFWEYLTWLNEANQADGIEALDIEAMLDGDMEGLAKFMPPDGRLLLAVDGDQVMGCVGLQRLGDDLGEIKRMYIKPAFRGQGLGRSLIERALEQARAIGYRTLRLDSARHMTAAHALYRSMGFVDIPPYEGEAPAKYHPHMVFMERVDEG